MARCGAVGSMSRRDSSRFRLIRGAPICSATARRAPVFPELGGPTRSTRRRERPSTFSMARRIWSTPESDMALSLQSGTRCPAAGPRSRLAIPRRTIAPNDRANGFSQKTEWNGSDMREFAFKAANVPLIFHITPPAPVFFVSCQGTLALSGGYGRGLSRRGCGWHSRAFSRSRSPESYRSEGR